MSSSVSHIIAKLPNTVRDDVSKLFRFRTLALTYARTEHKKFYHMLTRWIAVKEQLEQRIVLPALDDSKEEQALYDIAFIMHRYECEPEWIDAFFDSLLVDVKGKELVTIDDSLEYTYGVAEVFGLIVARILQLPIKPYEAASLQARALQWREFIRNARTDAMHGRCYFPLKSLAEHNLTDLTPKTEKEKPAEYKKFMAEQKHLVAQWQEEAKKAVSYLPKNLQNTHLELTNILIK